MPTTNSSIQFKHGLQEAFSNITKDSNTIYFITDTNRLFVGDSEYTRPVQHGAEVPTSKNPANSLFVKETGTSRELYYSKDGTAWDMIAYLPATITGGVFGDNTAGTVAYGGTVKVPKVTVDNRGYVTAVEDVNVTLPASDKVTTVTSSGDGNAVTGGSISGDGATLTLTKGESFVPASGGTFSGDVTIGGALTIENITPSSDSNSIININTTEDTSGDFPSNKNVYNLCLKMKDTGDDGDIVSDKPISIFGEYMTNVKFNTESNSNITTRDSYLSLAANQIKLYSDETSVYGSTTFYGPVMNIIGNRFATVQDIDNSISALTDTKVTTVTSSGDGNAVTSGSISNDGTTLTLTKGESFVPVNGGTFSGDVTISGDLTANSIKSNGTIDIVSTMFTGSQSSPINAMTIRFTPDERIDIEDPITISTSYRIEREVDEDGETHPCSEKELNISNVNALNVGSRRIFMSGDAELRGEMDAYGGIVVYGLVTAYGTVSNNNHLTPKKYVDNAIASAISASDAMVFKGTVGTSGTAASFSDINVSSATKGDTYKVITADTLPAASSFDSTAHDLTPGDLIVYMGESKFIYVPSGDEDVTSVKVAGSGDTINVSTTAQTGTVVLGDVATKNVSTSTTLNGNGASNDNVATELAVKTYVDDTVGALENTLGTAATTNATDYATAAQGTKADNAMPKSGGTFTGAVTLAGAPTTDLNAATKKYVDDSVSGVTDTKVTTVTTTGDGNAVTSGSISNDGTTLTLTKGTSFVPSTGGTFSGDITVSGNLTADDIKTSGEINITPNDNETTINVQFLNGGDSFNNDTTVSIESEYVPHSPAPGVPVNSNKTYLKLNSDVTQINSDTTEITGALNVSGRINDLDIESENQNNVYTCTISAGASAYVEFERANGYHNLKLNADDNIDLDASNINLNGNVTLSSVPSNNMHAATKKYVDDAVAAATLTWKTF